jgi:hypothetical protein
MGTRQILLLTAADSIAKRAFASFKDILRIFAYFFTPIKEAEKTNALNFYLLLNSKTYC